MSFLQRHSNESATVLREVEAAASWCDEWPFPTFVAASSSVGTSSTATSKALASKSVSSVSEQRLQVDVSSIANTTIATATTTTRSSSTMMRSTRNNTTAFIRNQNTDEVPKISALEVGVLRSLFGRGDTQGINNVTHATTTLLPHVDLRWLFTTPAAVLRAANDPSSQSPSCTTRTPVMCARSFIREPPQKKHLGNLFQNLQAVTQDWTLPIDGALHARGGTTVLLNSPRSAVTVLRNNIDLGELARRIATAHAKDPAELRTSATSQQRIRGNRDHQQLARQRRHRAEVQIAASSALETLKHQYDELCLISDLDSILEALLLEHAPRHVFVSQKTPTATPTAAAVCVVNRRAVSAERKREIDVSRHSAFRDVLELTDERANAALVKKHELLEARRQAARQRTVQRAELFNTQSRARILHDILKREAAAVELRAVTNLQRHTRFE